MVPRPTFLLEDIKEFMKRSKEVMPTKIEVDVVTLEGAKLEEKPNVVTKETFADQ